MWKYNGVSYKTWCDAKLAQLEDKGRANWDDDDFEAWAYCENALAETLYFDQE